jgi:hypothetical protein
MKTLNKRYDRETVKKAMDYINARIRELKKYPGYFADRDAEIRRLYKTRAKLQLDFGGYENECSDSVMETINYDEGA